MQAKLPADYTLEDAALENIDNSLQALYHPDLQSGKCKQIFVTYGQLGQAGMALEVFDGGVGMCGMDRQGITAWAKLVRSTPVCSAHYTQCMHG